MRNSVARRALRPSGGREGISIRWILGLSNPGRYEDSINTLCQISKLEARGYACLAAGHAQLGRVGEAEKIARECVEHSGECAMTTKDWRDFWRRQLKFREDAPIDHLIEGLDKAGLVKH